MTRVRPRLALARHVPAALLTASLGLFGSSGCVDNNPAGPDDCSDGLDNDGDGSIDFADPGCVLNNGLAEIPDPETFACDDDTDNDGDGFIDHPDDPGCDSLDDRSEHNELAAQCNDGIDNDGDARIDFPNDPGCFSRFANSEIDFCPVDARCPKCGNRWDDDGDGLLDYPDDPGCDAASDNDEFNADITNCGPDVSIEPLAPGGEAMGSVALGGQNQLISPTCGGLGQEQVYLLDVPEAAILDVTTAFPQTTLDTVLYLRTVCRDITTELACSDDAEDLSSRFVVAVEPGTYFLVVDAFHSTSEGNYRLRVDSYLPRGRACDPAMPACAPGYECRPVDDNATEPTCELPTCEDGLDNDFDGSIDYPNEPGCDSPADSDEHDDCPSGASCPACSNNQDDDGDGITDFPADLGCESAADDVEEDCNEESDPVTVLTAGTVSGTTTGATHDFTPSCAFSNTAPDRTFSLLANSPLLSLHVDTEGSSFDTMLAIKTPSCGDADIACDDDSGTGTRSSIDLTNVAAGPYFIIVDGFSASSGPFTLNVHGVIPAGGACDPATIASGLFSCEPNFTCDGAVCVLAACVNGVDDDSDGAIDFPYDPGCANPDDADESDDCTTMGPNCPSCGNGMDDDGDGAIDYPADPGCVSASDDTEENCMDSDPIAHITLPVVSGTTVGATDDFTPSCSVSNAPERVYVLDVPGTLQTLELNTNGSVYDTILYVRQPACTAADLACDDNSSGSGQSAINLVDVPPGPLFIFIDGYGSSAGSYVLQLYGVIAAGEACDPAQISAGILACAPGTSCIDPGSGFSCQ